MVLNEKSIHKKEAIECMWIKFRVLSVVQNARQKVFRYKNLHVPHSLELLIFIFSAVEFCVYNTTAWFWTFKFTSFIQITLLRNDELSRCLLHEFVFQIDDCTSNSLHSSYRCVPITLVVLLGTLFSPDWLRSFTSANHELHNISFYSIFISTRTNTKASHKTTERNHTSTRLSAAPAVIFIPRA